MTFDDDGEDLLLMQSFCREMIARSVFLHPYHNWFLCAAHTDQDIDCTLEAAEEAFKVTARLPVLYSSSVSVQR
jgi:glutamate-1-semialdehyde 2,1-aminomutase